MRTRFQKLHAQFTICLIFFFFTNTLWAQEENQSTSPFLKPDKEKSFAPFIALETWATYSSGEEKSNHKYADQNDVIFRRFRFGAKGLPYTWLSYSLQLQLERLGKDTYSSPTGKYTGVGIWNAFLTAKLLKNSEFLNLHVGYYWAAISREFNTSPWAVSSLDKTGANWYLRRFTTGKGNGIESGIGLGGLYNSANFGISYRIGLYEPEAYASPEYPDRLFTARIMFSFGEPEQTKYRYMLSGNQWGKRNGVTLGFGAAWQKDGRISADILFKKSNAYGADLLINYGGLRIDGEYYLMNRSAEALANFEGAEYHLRLAYSFIIANKFIEPAFCYEFYEGKGESLLFDYVGKDSSYDVGINWYVNKDRLRVGLHYVIQESSGISNVGDYLGAELQFVL